jgi:hypothetical protein
MRISMMKPIDSCLVSAWIVLLKISTIYAVFAVLLGHAKAQAVDSQVNPKVRYEQALLNIRASGILSKSGVPGEYFSSLDWVGKTALINLVCHSAEAKNELCQAVVNLGLVDEALVVRDHSLRTVLANQTVSGSVKEHVAQKIVEDDRNYRKGKAFWIVQNAQSYLRLAKKRENSE